MRTKRRYKKVSSRYAATAARRWRNARWRWRAGDKTVWFFACLAGVVIATFGFLLNTVHAAKVEQQSLRCLALNIYFEARGEPRAGQYAVAEVTMNRVASSRYPKTVCAVVYQKNWDYLRKRDVAAFSWTELRKLPEPKGKEWDEAWKIAAEVYYRRKEPKLAADALHYHAEYVTPSWSRELTPIARIGSHVFYR